MWLIVAPTYYNCYFSRLCQLTQWSEVKCDVQLQSKHNLLNLTSQFVCMCKYYSTLNLFGALCRQNILAFLYHTAWHAKISPRNDPASVSDCLVVRLLVRLTLNCSWSSQRLTTLYLAYQSPSKGWIVTWWYET